MPGVFTEMCVHVECFGVPKDWKFLEKRAARLEHVGEKQCGYLGIAAIKNSRTEEFFNIISHMYVCKTTMLLCACGPVYTI